MLAASDIAFVRSDGKTYYRFQLDGDKEIVQWWIGHGDLTQYSCSMEGIERIESVKIDATYQSPNGSANHGAGQ
jgi:hypothetical protein